MTYDVLWIKKLIPLEEALCSTVTRKEALKELEAQGFKADGADVRQFFDDLGDRPTYSGREVLTWLGY